MKIQVALTVENSIAAASVDGRAQRLMRTEDRSPGPVGISLMHDDVSMSVRDLVTAMLTVSDNVATDELIAVVGLDEINATTRRLGMVRTLITSDIRGMLKQLARDVGLPTYRALASHDPKRNGPPSEDEVRRRVAVSAALDPHLGTRTTAREAVTLLKAIWTDHGGPPRACAAVRHMMGQQLTRHRIAAGFAPPASVRAMSGGLMRIIRNEAGVFTFPDGHAMPSPCSRGATATAPTQLGSTPVSGGSLAFSWKSSDHADSSVATWALHRGTPLAGRPPRRHLGPHLLPASEHRFASTCPSRALAGVGAYSVCWSASPTLGRRSPGLPGGGHSNRSSSGNGGAAAEPGWEMGRFKLKCTPAIRMEKQMAAARTATAPP